MTETQAAADARAAEAGKAVQLEKAGSGAPADAGNAPTSAPPQPHPHDTAHGGSGAPGDSDGVGPATGRAAVPKFTRAPGMPPPPDVLVPSQGPNDSIGTQGIPVGVGAAAAQAQSAGHGRGSPVPVIAGPGARGAASVGTGGLGGPGGLGVLGGAAGQGTTTGPITSSARVTEAVRAARATVTSAAGRGPRRARLHLRRIDPWSTMKFSFAVSLVLFFVAVVATSVLYLALDQMGVFDTVNDALAEMIGNAGGEGSFKITAKGVVGGSALLGAVNVVLFTALATLGAFIYNVCADLVGGIELTLAEKD
jgi:hypothetical protein